MVIRRIELTDFRIYKHAVIELDPGVTAVMGLNAQGKTSLAEAMSYLSTLQSFRGVANDALVREGARFQMDSRGRPPKKQGFSEL